MYFCTRLSKRDKWFDPLAQLVEHNTFNVRVMGSSPMRVTKRESCQVLLFLLTYSRLIDKALIVRCLQGARVYREATTGYDEISQFTTIF